VEENNVKLDEMSTGTAVQNEAGPDDSAAARQNTAQKEQLKAERDELKDMLLRRQAEFDNFRKRSERERSDFLQYAGMEIVREMLPILDDFERALKNEGSTPEYARGIEMIYKRMSDTLKKLGLEPIDTQDAMFDPNLHQAIERVETDSAPDGRILSEFQRGYHFKGKLLRPSMVKVAVHS
jgi:molecular chaperone GrpE